MAEKPEEPLQNVRFLWVISGAYALAIKMPLKDNGDGDADKDLFSARANWFSALRFPCQTAWLRAVTINSPPSETTWMTIIVLVCINIWLGGPQVAVGKNFKSTCKFSELCLIFEQVHGKLMCFVCQCSQQLLKILLSKPWVSEGFLGLSGCNGSYCFPCCPCFVLPTHSYLNFLDRFSSVNFCHILPWTIIIKA